MATKMQLFKKVIAKSNQKGTIIIIIIASGRSKSN